ncbi:ABC transporter ATP-binding protein [Cupriavidus plantarum]|uniref:Amino acid/amide ABC transporter ATP-binding protein 2 (HAAT family) n=1 Tax=Cupriavidus plantarum TaxID=942865 RepID=A0A316ELA4_9BURK|nr:ABC transporter ATP-binding protein [Cupriavidus plantarum]NYI02371.1 branched-chain amino acid transport system ATP-binding protein [Cupriavidus plantarum]PWK31576.1 amino acid/amide ABC transporter ATP-binding protein 2 (HAAT family) [Cupriavidus plantarum]RLK28775.1 amino acid/amide ABC transporter ATP-binding protein 2 (HAAT family) [Cupriavidus plantarum]CAG2145920.1 High-affinity branched-chain amino acid transport ATP-binding protein LivF [Cupriavidus plantarum]SMR86667.1 amino acid/
MLKVEQISVRYGPAVGVERVSIEVREGELVTLIGANGAGKSTTLRAISGLEPLVHGRITFDGHQISGASAAAVIERGVAHCPEGRRVFPQLTVAENLEMGAYRRIDRNRVRQDRERMLDRFPRLRERLKQAAGTLSGGEQQMLAIARALMARPRLVMFDEPSLGLAPNFVEMIFELILEVRREGTTVLMVEQNAYAALEMCDRAYLLENGRVVNEGPADKMLADPNIRRAYLGG